MFIVPISPLPSVGSIEQLNKVQPEQSGGSGVPFANILSDAMDSMRETEAQSREDAYNLAMGQMDDLHTMQINSAKAAAAMEFTVELTTRAVNAYNEILRMQV